MGGEVVEISWRDGSSLGWNEGSERPQEKVTWKQKQTEEAQLLGQEEAALGNGLEGPHRPGFAPRVSHLTSTIEKSN